MYLYAKPDDGFAYSPIELTAIWSIPVSDEAIAEGRVKIFHFHEYMRNRDARHRDAADLLLRDSLAQLMDPVPADLPEVCRKCGGIWLGIRPNTQVEGVMMTRCCGIALKTIHAETEDDGA